MRSETILPGGRIGILGGGQLGRMTAFAAKRMGYWVATLDPDPHAPCGQVVDHQITASYSDLEAVKRFGRLCDVITYEFENVSAESVEALEAQGKIVRPHSRALKIKQSRLTEKESLRKAGIEVADSQPVRSPEELKAASKRIGFPAVLKTLSWGYDGKGQAGVDSEEQALRALEAFGWEPVLWERRVPFVKELGIVGARGLDGEIVTYPLTENVHVEGILDTAMAPARVPDHVKHKAQEIARTVAVAFDLVGTFCVEMFLLEEGRILVNEIAPRPHNSGHYSIEACVTSQFEQHVRAICGLPLGSTELRSAAAMVNLLGSGKGDTLIGVEQLLKEPAVALHLYGKREARPKRKMGHFTLLANSPEEALKRAERLRGKLAWTPAVQERRQEGVAG